VLIELGELLDELLAELLKLLQLLDDVDELVELDSLLVLALDALLELSSSVMRICKRGFKLLGKTRCAVEKKSVSVRSLPPSDVSISSTFHA
jgi:hypothetical protein